MISKTKGHLFAFLFVVGSLTCTSSQRPAPKKEYSSYRRMPLCSPSHYFRYPKSLSDAVDIVKEAIATGTTVKPFGSRHSQTDIICTEGIPVDTYGLNWKQLNGDNTATFGVGVSLREATEFLRLKGRAFRMTPQYGNITIGGAVGTGAHGSTLIHNASLSSQVVAMTVVDGLGQVREIRKQDDLNAFRIHLGLLGFIISVTFDTVPLYKMRGWSYVVSDSILVDGTVALWAKQTDQMTLYWFPSVQKVVVMNWTIVDVNTPGNGQTNDHVPAFSQLLNTLFAPTGEIVQNLCNNACSALAAVGYSTMRVIEKYFLSTLYKQTQLFVPIFTEDGETVKNPAVGYYDLMTAPTCRENGTQPLKCTWAHKGFNVTILDTEFGVDFADLPKLIGRFKDVVSKVPTAFPLQGVIIRLAGSSDMYMSGAYGRDTAHVEFFMTNRNHPTKDPASSLGPYQLLRQIMVKQFKARAHWGKNGLTYFSKDVLDNVIDPIARQKFVEKMKEYDPNGVFMNNFGRRMTGEGTRIDVDTEATRCALLDYCVCSKNSDCGSSQYCGAVDGYPDMPVCRTDNDNEVNRQMQVHDGAEDNLVVWLSTRFPANVAKGKLQCAATLASGKGK